MALVTYHGPRPEITASFPMSRRVPAFSSAWPASDILTFRNGRPDEPKKPGPHSYVLPRDHAVPVGVVFAVGLAILARGRGLNLVVRLAPGDWSLACAAFPGLRRVTPRMLATPRRRRLIRAMLRRREGLEIATVQRCVSWEWVSPQAMEFRDDDEIYRRVTYRRTFRDGRVRPDLRWPRRAVSCLPWDTSALRASATRNLSVNEDLDWRPHG